MNTIYGDIWSKGNQPVLILRLGFFYMLTNMAFGYTITLTESQLQAQIDEFMPIERKQLLTTFVFSDPKLELISSVNKVGLSIHLDVISPVGLKGSGSGAMLGSIEYRKESGEFFIADTEVTRITIKNVPDRISRELKKVFQSVLAKLLAKYPVYTLDQNDFKQKMTKSLLKSIEVKDHKLVIELNPF